MEAPPVHYATTEDGISIAYWVVGQGPALLYGPPIFHATEVWRVPDYRRWLEALAGNFRLACFDVRGTGLSGDTTEDTTPELFALDFHAVSEAAGFSSAAVLAEQVNGPAAITYATLYPAEVSRLILSNTYASYKAFGQRARASAALSRAVSDDPNQLNLLVPALSGLRVRWAG